MGSQSHRDRNDSLTHRVTRRNGCDFGAGQIMETRNGVRGVVFDDVFFCEVGIPNATPIKPLHVEISLQNSNLDEVKRRLAEEAKRLGANAIMNFHYGQKKHEWWELIFTFKWDTESWHGEGVAVRA